MIGDKMNEFKKKMKEKIAIYSNKEYLDGYMRNEFMTDDSDADIYLHLENRDELFDSRTIDRQLDLVSDVYDYIEDKSSMLDSDVQIELHITGLDLDAHDQGVVRHILKEHYAIELYKVQKEYTRIKRKIFNLIVVGLISFILYSLLFFISDFEFGIEILGFLFSFALWEGFDSMIYDFKEIKREREDVTQNLLTNVVFEEEKEN